MPTALHAQPCSRSPMSPDAAAGIRFSDETAHADQAWLSKPEAHSRNIVTNTYPGSYWEDKGYDWFGGS